MEYRSVRASAMVKSMAFVFLVGALLPNAVFVGVAGWLGIGRPFINLDYIFAALFFVFGWRWFSGLLCLVFLLIDVLALVGQVLPFVRFADIVYLLKFSASASDYYRALLVAVCLVVMAKLVLFARLGGRLQQAETLVVFNVLVAIYAVHANSSERGGDRFYRVAGGELVSSQAVAFWRGRSEGFLELFGGKGAAVVSAGVGGATAPWSEELALSRQGQRLLLVINESWGVPLEDKIQEKLLEPLAQLNLMSLKQGRLRFDGVTLGGELRELCNLSPKHYNLKEVVKGFDGCLPNRLKAQGYTTAALHGAMSLLYDRRYWYPRAGFEQTTFFESKLWPRRCRSFPGACDLDLLAEVEAYFKQPGRRFFYWLTLNSHSTYDARDVFVDVFDCQVYGVDPASESCRNLKLQAQFFYGLGRLLDSDDMRGVDVIVVGDHAPVIMSLKDKDAVFVEGEVPWIRFVVK